MIQLFERAVQSAKALPDHLQDEAGKMLLAVVEQEESPLSLSMAQQAEVRRRIISNEQLVPAEEMAAFFRKLAR